MSNYSFRTLEDIDESEYEDFLSRCPHALFYHSVKYKKFLKELLACDESDLIVEQNGKIVASLPLMKKQFSQGTVINSLPYFGSHGGILYTDLEPVDLLLEEYNRMIKKDDVISSTVISNPFAEIADFPFPHNHTDYRIGQYTPLPSQGQTDQIREQLLSSFESSTRRNINKATHSKIRISVDNTAMKKLEELHQENISAKNGLCKSTRFFNLIPEYFRQGHDYNLFVSHVDGEIVGALLLFYYKNTVEYFTPGLDEKYRTLQPLALIIFEAMVDAASRGFTTWNWGGTWESQEGVFRFKKKWGSLSRNYTYFTQLNSEELLEMAPEDLLKEFQNFYILPFSALKSEARV